MCPFANLKKRESISVCYTSNKCWYLNDMFRKYNNYLIKSEMIFSNTPVDLKLFNCFCVEILLTTDS